MYGVCDVVSVVIYVVFLVLLGFNAYSNSQGHIKAVK